MNDWIKWEGGECPVDGEATVEIRFSDGNKTIEITGKAADCEWRSYHGLYHDIVAYRVVKEPIDG